MKAAPRGTTNCPVAIPSYLKSVGASRSRSAIAAARPPPDRKGIPMFSPLRKSVMSLITVLAMSAPAFAHAHLKTATPAANAKVAASPKELDLHFTEGLNLAFTGITLKGPSGSKIATGKAELKSGDDQTLVVPLLKALKAGKYQVSWHALSKDGHKTKGTYHFTVTPK